MFKKYNKCCILVGFFERSVDFVFSFVDWVVRKVVLFLWSIVFEEGLLICCRLIFICILDVLGKFDVLFLLGFLE